MLKKRFKKSIRALLIQSNQSQLLYSLSRAFYRLGLSVFVQAFKNNRSIASIYVRNSFVTGTWVPWASDVDVTVIIEDMQPQDEIAFLERFWRKLRILKLFFPFIRDIDLLNRREFVSETMKYEPGLNFLIRYLHCVSGQDIAVTPLYGDYCFSSFRLHDWLQWLDHYYEANLDREKYVRKYFSLFNKILKFSGNQEQSPNSTHLKKLVQDAERVGFYAQNTRDFFLEGYYYSLCVLKEVYQRMPIQQTGNYTRCPINNGPNHSDSFLEKAKHFVSNPSADLAHIKSIFVDSGSIQNDNKTIWVILCDDISKEKFKGVVENLKKTYLALFDDDTNLFVFFEDVLNLFLAQQRLWAFESWHLTDHAKVIWGDNILDNLRGPSKETIRRMFCSSTIIYKNWLRNMMNPENRDEFPGCLLDILSWRLFIEKGIITTTTGELSKVYNRYYQGEENSLLGKCVQGETAPKKEVFSILTSVLGQFPRIEKDLYERV